MKILRTSTLLAAFVLPAAAQEPPSTLQAAETPWEVSCTSAGESQDLACAMTKSLVLAEDSRLVASATVTREAEGYAMRLLTPHGLAVPQGLTLAIDGIAFPRAAFTTSLPAGIVARIELVPDLLSALTAGESLTVTARQLGGGDFSFSLALRGFTAGLEKLE